MPFIVSPVSVLIRCLLSCFSFLFCVQDRNISDHVLRNHRYQPSKNGDSRAVGVDDGKQDDDDALIERDDEETEVFQKFDKHLFGARGKDNKRQVRTRVTSRWIALILGCFALGRADAAFPQEVHRVC